MEEKNLKRRRVNGTHRWSDAETLHLLEEVAKAVKNKPEMYEKPTARLFYKRISAVSAVLKTIDWVPMKNKMRHLKSTYTCALNWKNQTGDGLLASGDEKSVKEYIAKICPKWNNLEQIFGQRRDVNLSIKTEAIDIDNGVEENLFLYLSNDDSLETSENARITSPEPSPSSQSSLDSTFLKESIRKLQQTAPKNKDSNLFSMLFSLQEKKLDIEIKKFEIEKEMATSEIELERAKLEQDFEIRKLQVESNERIRKYELELKYKSTTN